MARDTVGGAGSEGDKGGGVPSKGKKFEKRFEYQNPETFASAEVRELQWNLLIRTPLGPAVLSFVARLSSFRVSFIRGSTVCHIALRVLTRVQLTSSGPKLSSNPPIDVG